MALNNYGELKDAVRSYLNYGDAAVEANLELFIKMAYDNVNSSVRIPSMEARVYHDVTIVRNDLPIPIDYIELKRMYYDDSYETLNQIDVNELAEAKYTNSTISSDGRPIQFARDDDSWILNRDTVVGTRINIVYWQNIPYPVDDTDTDVFIDQVDGALLYRSLAEAFRFLEDFETSEYWMAKAAAELIIVQENADSAEVSGSIVVQSQNPWY